MMNVSERWRNDGRPHRDGQLQRGQHLHLQPLDSEHPNGFAGLDTPPRAGHRCSVSGGSPTLGHPALTPGCTTGTAAAGSKCPAPRSESPSTPAVCPGSSTPPTASTTGTAAAGPTTAPASLISVSAPMAPSGSSAPTPGSTTRRAAAGSKCPARGPRSPSTPAVRPWVINFAHGLYHWNGSSWTYYGTGFSDIGIGANGSFWVIGTNSGIYYPKGSGWVQVPGAGPRSPSTPAVCPGSSTPPTKCTPPNPTR